MTQKGPVFTEITKPAIITGRNHIPVPPDEVEMMAKIGCTNREIAQHYGVNENTLGRVFEAYLARGRSELRQRLRQTQLRVAFDGNPTMLIWLGRNILGQNETPYDTADNEPLPWNHDEIVTSEIAGEAEVQAQINIENTNETT